MSFLVFALGLLLSVAGMASIYSGYSAIDGERGLTAVLAGTTALSAGIMTIGISFILRCLVRLQAFLETEKGFLPLLSELAFYQTRQNLRQSGPVAVRGIEVSSATPELRRAAVGGATGSARVTVEAEDGSGEGRDGAEGRLTDSEAKGSAKL